MRLFLAAAVLFLAFVAYADAQDRSLGETLTNVRDHVTSVGSAFLENSKAVVEDISNSEAVVKAKTWLRTTFEDMQRKLTGK